MTGFDEQVQLETGQFAQLRGGIVQVTKSPAFPYYRLTAEHTSAAICEATAPSYDQLVRFAKQLERLDYRLIRLEQIPAAA